MIFERLLLLPLFLAVVVYVAVRRRYLPRNLLLVAGGYALVIGAIAIDPSAGVLIALGALGAGLWVRGVDDERRRAIHTDDAVPGTAKES